MKTQPFINLLLVSLLCFSCNTAKNKGEALSFPTVNDYQTLAFEIQNDDHILGFPSDMIFMDSALIIYSHKPHNCITVYDLKNNEVLETGRKGKGPGELLTPMGIIRSNLNGKFFEIYDFSKKALFLFHTDSCRIHHESTMPEEYRVKNLTTYQCAFFNEQSHITNGLFDDHYQFQITDTLGNVKTQFGDYNFNPDDKNGAMNKSLAYQGPFSLCGNKMAWACSSSMILQTYRLSNDYTVTKVGSLLGSLPKYVPDNRGRGHSSALSADNIKGYLDMATTNERIYLLYSGKKYKKEDMSDAVKSNIIHVYDWQANPVEKIIIDKEIVNFAIDEAGRKIYGITHNPEPQIVYFQL